MAFTGSQIAVIGAPLDLGAGRRGVDMGPSAIRVANLDARLGALGYTVTDIGNVDVKQAESMDAGPKNARFLPEIAVACKRLASMVEKAAGAGQFPLVLGGDHSIAVGTVSGLARHYRKKKQSIGLIWVDAHADMNTPKTSPSGNVHGMPLACLLGDGPRELTHLYNFAPKVNPKNVVLVGLRDLDTLEKGIIRKTGVHAYTMREIDERGMRAVMEDALRIACSDTAGFHLSFDMDSVDPQFAPGVGTPVRGGITYREAHLAMEIASDSGRMVGLEVVEVNPVIDEVNRTAELAVELVLSALGKKIL
ncbi:MAG: arginase [Bryobacterales bacterium]|nr:arginase [Bryobacterales bacterium]